MQTRDGLLRREDINTRSVQELRNTIEVEGTRTLSADFLNDTVIMHTPTLVGDIITLPAVGRIGTFVTYMNVGELDGAMSDGTTSYTLEPGQGMIFVLAGAKWIPSANAEVVEGRIIARPTKSEVIFDGWTDHGGTNVPEIPVIGKCQGYFKTISIGWDDQLDLTNFKRYDLQVSDDDTTWYSPQTDGSDWKDSLGGTMSVYESSFTHPDLPLAGSIDAPAGITLYYRVRRVTAASPALESAWSTSATASTYGIDAGQIVEDAISSAKIVAGAIDDMTKFSSEIRPPRVVSSLPTSPFTGYVAGDTVVLTVDDKLYRFTGTEFTVAVDGADIVANSITAGQISAGAIGASEISAGVITADKMNIGSLGELDPTDELGALQDNIDDAEEYSQQSDFSKYSGTVTGMLNSVIYKVPCRATSSGANEVRKLFDITLTSAYTSVNIGGPLWFGSSGRYQYSTDLQVNLTVSNPATNLGRMDAALTGGDSQLLTGTHPYIKVTRETTGTGQRLRIYMDVGHYSGVLWDAQLQKNNATTINIWQTGLDESDVIEGTLQGLRDEEWRKSGTTSIDGGNIYTDSIVAGSIASNAITATKIATNAVTAEKILAGTITAEEMHVDALEAQFLEAEEVNIGFTGSGEVKDASAGDRKTFIDGDEIQVQEYLGDEGTYDPTKWSTVNGVKIGGVDGSGVFTSGVSCRQVVNPLADTPSQESVPGPTFRAFSYETNLGDQFGNLPDVSTNVEQGSGWSKFGSKSLSAISSSLLGSTSYNDLVVLGQNVVFGCWVNLNWGGTPATVCNFFGLTYQLTVPSVQFLSVSINYDPGFERWSASLTEYIGGSYLQQVLVTSEMSIAEAEDTPHYVGAVYDFDNLKLYLVVDGEVSVGTVASPTITSAGTTNKVEFVVTKDYGTDASTINLDDVCFSTDEASPVDILIQHYNHNVPWNTDYSAKDVAIIPAEGGYVNLQHSPTKHYAPVAGEKSAGTYIPLPHVNRPSAWVLSGGTADSYTDVDFSSYVPTGVKALRLRYQINWTGDGAQDVATWNLRQNGVTTTDNDRMYTLGLFHTNWDSGKQKREYGQLTMICDSDGVIEYKSNYSPARGYLYLNIQGYYI